MTTNHGVIWIDHKEAHVLYFDSSKNELIKSDLTHTHLHHKANAVGSGNAPEDHKFFHTVISAAADVNEILVVGPGSAKGELIKHAATHDAAIAKKIIGIETVDHLTDPQVLAYAKKYFIRTGRMIVD
ncbi:MAG: translational machinery protein [Sheuella sp.]|nr:translational machinery protein [Sheuella sp.]